MTTRHTTARLLLATALLTGTLAACSGTNGGASGTADVSGSGGAPASRAEAPRAADSQAGGGKAAGGGSGDDTNARVLPFGRDIVYRAALTVRTRDVAAATTRAEDVAASVDGLVFAEESTTEPVGPRAATRTTRTTMTLRVPPESFRDVLGRLGGLGTVLSRSQNAQDVTGEVVDVRSRLASQRASVARMQALMDRATSVAAIVAIEGELARREADLESLEAQQKKLSDLTGMATVDLTLVAPPHQAAPPKKADHVGFLTGLEGGWHALTAVVLVAVTAAGAVLPFVLLLGVLGLPGWYVVRNRRRGTPPAAAPTAPGGS